MRALTEITLALLATAMGALGLYEVTATSPAILGHALPGWLETRQVEEATPWQQPTGILPVDKLLHESEEAVRYYGLLARNTF